MASFNEIINKALPIANAAQSVLVDPATGEIVCLATRLSRMTEGRDPGRPCAKVAYSADDYSKGLGLASAVKPIRFFSWLRENPAIAALIVGSSLGLFWYWGFEAGYRKRGKVL